MQVLFIIGSLSSGGAERVVSEMSNYWVRKGWNLSILTTNATKKKQDFYPLDSRIKRVDITPLKKLYKVAYFYNLFRNLRAKIKNEKPDVVISFMSGSNIVTFFSMLGLKIPLIISDRHNPYTDKIGYLYKKIFYPISNILVVQTEAVKKFYSNIGGLQIETIPNPIREFCQIENINKKSKIVSAVGRLNISIKGFDILIKSFAKISNNYKDWKLIYRVLQTDVGKRKYLKEVKYTFPELSERDLSEIYEMIVGALKYVSQIDFDNEENCRKWLKKYRIGMEKITKKLQKYTKCFIYKNCNKEIYKRLTKHLHFFHHNPKDIFSTFVYFDDIPGNIILPVQEV